MFQPAMKSGGNSELGVESQHLYRELDFVRHTLAGAVSAIKQFKIFDRVIGAYSIFVVHSFCWKQRAAQVLFHYVAMLQNFCSFAAVGERWHRKVDVPVFFGVSSEIACVESIERGFGLRSNLAFGTAKFLVSVNAKLVSIAAACFQLAAVLAYKFVSLVSVLAAACVRTGHRAVKGIATEFLFVRSQVGLHHDEWLAAFFAGEANRRSASGRRIFMKVLTAARDAAVFAPGFDFAWVAVKRLLATQAFHLDRHSVAPLLGGRGGYSCAGRECQVTYAG
jgi:hypothetical protein